MAAWPSRFSGVFVAAPLLCGGLVGGTTSEPQSSCLTLALTSETSGGREELPSFLVRGYLAVDKGDLLYSIERMERLWTYFVDEAESFTPEEAAVIDKEFWTLG
ncbi:MAG: hypothetical protein AB1646_08100 [Thermodesulfobacteriota bacterium]